ncbi:MAG TPA: PepSY domain-containing protein [Mycobacteriales bacterium]|nr:PepSY domain-containing protein [Mycobacteriales bacterium]
MRLTRAHWLVAIVAVIAGAIIAFALVTLRSTTAGPRPPYGSSNPVPQANAATSPPPAAGVPAAPRLLTLPKAQGIAERAVGGRSIEIDLDHEDTGATYDVKVVRSDGTIYKVTVDAVSGRVLRTKIED